MLAWGEITVPTVLRFGSYRFHFYSDEYLEPPHVHIETADGECKFWLDPVRLARNKGVPPLEVRHLEKLVFEHQVFLEEKFHEFHKR